MSRPLVALVIRVCIRLGPIVIVSALAWMVHLSLGRPITRSDAIVRWATLAIVSMAALSWLDKLTRRFIPLAVLFKISLVFPEEAPSRFRVALKRGSTRALERALEAGELDSATPQEAAEYLVAMATRLRAHDRRTRGHSERVRAYADLIAEEMNLDEAERQKLHWAALVHDVGKLCVPEPILNKAGRPDGDEWNILRTHPDEGWRLVSPLQPWLGEWADATRDHHERWDGSGYPQGLVGEQISRAGRIVAVADAYDVMTSARSYKRPMPASDAREELISCSGSHFDPLVVRAFLAASLKREGRTAGPLAWLTQSPTIMRVGSVAQLQGTVASAAVAATVAAGPMMLADDEIPTPQPVSAAREVVLPPPTTTTTTAAPPTTTTVAPTTTTTTTTSTTTTTTTTAPPTTTTAPPTTTTAPPPVQSVPVSTLAGGFLQGGGPGATLVSEVSGTGLLNHDAGANSDPGLTLPRHADGLIELSADHVQVWSMEAQEDLIVAGDVSLEIWIAVAGYDPDGLGVLRVGLASCETLLASCTTLSARDMPFVQAEHAEFGRLVADLGSVAATVPAGSHLVLAVATPLMSTHDLWISYGTSTHPARIWVI